MPAAMLLKCDGLRCYRLSMGHGAYLVQVWLAETGIRPRVLSPHGPLAEGDSTSTNVLLLVSLRVPVQLVHVAQFFSVPEISNAM